jgi:hypothetical protein
LAGGEQSARQPAGLQDANDAPDAEPEEEDEDAVAPPDEEPEEEPDDGPPDEEEPDEEEPEEAPTGPPDVPPDDVPEDDPDPGPPDDPPDEDPDDDPEDEPEEDPPCPPIAHWLASDPHAARAQRDAASQRPAPDDPANLAILRSAIPKPIADGTRRTRALQAAYQRSRASVAEELGEV